MFVYYLCVAVFNDWRMLIVAVVVSLPLLMMFSFVVPLSFSGCLFVAHVLYMHNHNVFPSTSKKAFKK